MSLMWKGDQDTETAVVRRVTTNKSQPRYGVIDTTFATVDMGEPAVQALLAQGIAPQRIFRRTVPGFKDLAVAAKQMIEQGGCDIVVVCGMVGPEPIDKQCGHEASLAIGQAQLMTSTHILEAFVHMDEAASDAELVKVCENRVAEHAVNAFWILERPEELAKRAGTGQRQGFQDVGPADPARASGRHLQRST
ncbi:MAG: riboflavin synthase [Thermoplasmatota archaeon]|nr:riboflavin synthase [Halobacteriales archaeon]